MSLQFHNTQVNSGQSATIEFEEVVANAYAVLAGFSVGYGSVDHQVQTMQATMTLERASEAGSLTVTATASVSDRSGNTGDGSLYVMGIGQSKDDLTVFRDVSWHPGKDGQVPLTIEHQPAPLDRAWVFVKGFKLTYGRDDHEVQTIAVDAGNSTLQYASVPDAHGKYTWTITFTPSLAMRDDSGNKQDSSSTLDLLVMAAPASISPAG